MRCLIALAIAVAAAAASAQEPPAGPLATRTFTARYRAVEEIVALIQPAISARGSYTVQPRIKAVTVTDTFDSVRRIEELISGYDLPPRAISLVIQVMRAEEGAPQPKPQRRLGLPPSVIQDVTKWGVITPIGSASLVTAENEKGLVAVGTAPEEYRVQFKAGAVSARIGVIRMERFALERVRRGPDGQPHFTPLMDLVLNLKHGVTTVLGATSSQDSKQAIFASVTATAQEP